MVGKKSRGHINSDLEFKKKKHAQEMKYQVL
ncbi:cytochrome B6, partial [Bacillus inaquosorum]|nr:cytochrome B6 [Bacillus inaquosorum]